MEEKNFSILPHVPPHPTLNSILILPKSEHHQRFLFILPIKTNKKNNSTHSVPKKSIGQ